GTTVQLGLGLALGRLDHERAGHRPAHRRRVITVVHETLGGVVHLDAVLLPTAQIDDALVRDEAGVAAVEHREKRLQALGDVVGVEDGDLGRLGEAGRTHHADIHPGDDQDAGRAKGRGRHRARARAGQEGLEVRGHADGADAGAAAAVRDAEGLVQVEVADVGADVAGRGQADLRVHVGAVHVNLAAGGVDRGADFQYRGFEYAVGGRVGDHQRGELGGVFVGLGLEVGDVDVALRVAGDGDDGVAAHDG